MKNVSLSPNSSPSVTLRGCDFFGLRSCFFRHTLSLCHPEAAAEGSMHSFPSEGCLWRTTSLPFCHPEQARPTKEEGRSRRTPRMFVQTTLYQGILTKLLCLHVYTHRFPALLSSKIFAACADSNCLSTHNSFLFPLCPQCSLWFKGFGCGSAALRPLQFKFQLSGPLDDKRL
jgi:hypothetical protein